MRETEPAVDRARGLLSAYLEGDVSPEERAFVESTVATHVQLRKELDALRATMGKLGGLKRSAPPAFLDNIQSQINRRSRGRFFRKRWMLFGRIPWEWASLVMIIAMLAYYIATLQGSPTHVTPAP